MCGLSLIQTPFTGLIIDSPAVQSEISTTKLDKTIKQNFAKYSLLFARLVRNNSETANISCMRV